MALHRQAAKETVAEMWGEGESAMRGEHLQGEISYIVTICGKCHVPFALTREFHLNRVRTKDTFYCPNGHIRSFKGESDTEQLEKAQTEIDLLKRSLTTAERSTASYKGQATRLRNKYEPIEEDSNASSTT